MSVTDLSGRTLSATLLARIIFWEIQERERRGEQLVDALVNQRTYDNHIADTPLASLCPDPDGEKCYGVRLVVVP